MTKTEEEKLNAFHRQQLRKILNIKYPVKITNSSLYEKCNECPLSITLLESRWRLFGHILRRNSEIPANKSMNSYFISHGSKFRGRPLTTLPVVLNKDLTRVSDDKLQLTSLKDLEHLRSVAQNRQTWRKLTTRIREAAEASPSDDRDAEGPKSSKSVKTIESYSVYDETFVWRALGLHCLIEDALFLYLLRFLMKYSTMLKRFRSGG